MEKIKRMRWTEFIEKMTLEDTEYAALLLEEVENIQREAFINGYEYAITILQESIVKNKER